MIGFREILRGLPCAQVLAMVSALLIVVPASAETRVGVVDLRQALFSSDEAKLFSEELKEEFADTEAEVREAQKEARRLQERLQGDGAMMNESERAKLSEEFQDRADSFNRRKQELDQTLNSRKQAFLEEARPRVDAAIKELMEEHELDLILPSEAVVAVKPELNLTDELLEKLNQ